MDSDDLENRDAFLSDVWKPYPSAPPGAVDVGRFDGRGWACGRAIEIARGWALEWDGETMPFAFDPACEWTEGARVAPSIVRAGDVLALRAERRAHAWFAIKATLLAPCLEAPVASARAGSRPERGREWARFIDAVRARFKQKEFTEARTPTLVPSPGTEPYLESFATEYRESGRQPVPLHLPTSPEFHLKRLLANGWSRVFEIKDCFRNGESGEHHQPEFAMLEWYRAFATLDEIARDAEDLIEFCARALKPWEAPPPPAKTTTVRELFAVAFPGFTLAPSTSESQLRALCEASGQPTGAEDGWDDLFFRLFLARIEPTLGAEGPLIVRDYPPRLSALSRLKSNGWADRMEIYWKGLELANGFHELNDPDECVARFAHDRAVRARLGRKPFPQDDKLAEALRAGMPPAGGVALGLDRLFMAIMDVSDIRETRAFPFGEGSA